VRFEPLREEHLATMHRWLNAPHVVEFYSRHPSSYEEVS